MSISDASLKVVVLFKSSFFGCSVTGGD